MMGEAWVQFASALAFDAGEQPVGEIAEGATASETA